MPFIENGRFLVVELMAGCHRIGSRRQRPTHAHHTSVETAQTTIDSLEQANFNRFGPLTLLEKISDLI